jgi:hypothetical protein
VFSSRKKNDEVVPSYSCVISTTNSSVLVPSGLLGSRKVSRSGLELPISDVCRNSGHLVYEWKVDENE